ncbi:toprim domain-containing protein [Paraglaciecola mesophila]|mgnify:CR=1 FL=1|uniref:Toprim domain-containing protein n=1 Tax=Paraglaciecola mesophila TaxID=197222 RepID=A0ABU9SPY7_9ALTE
MSFQTCNIHHLNIHAQLTAAINFGLQIDTIEQDERLHRVSTRLKPKSKNGWYIAYSDFLIMGDWQTGTTQTFKPNNRKPTRIDKQRIKKLRERIKLEKETLQKQTAKYANELYQKASHIAVHAYLDAKQVDAANGLKLIKNQLLVPLYDLASGKMENLQLIYPNGTKRFLKNGRIKGLCFPYGLLNTQLDITNHLTKVFICEGFATAASIYEMTKQPVLAAMNAYNLLPVARQALKKWPNIEIVIAGDDDYLTEQRTYKNPGKIKALEAAYILGLKVSFPPFTLEQKLVGLTDWNDYYIAASNREVV